MQKEQAEKIAKEFLKEFKNYDGLVTTTIMASELKELCKYALTATSVKVPSEGEIMEAFSAYFRDEKNDSYVPLTLKCFHAGASWAIKRMQEND